jgi:tetratricopeptide (TPR) repeat protein
MVYCLGMTPALAILLLAALTAEGGETAAADPVPTQSEPPPAEAQPAEAVPAEAQPAEAVPAEAQPAEAEPAGTQPAEAKPADAEPTETQPAEVQPSDTPPVPAVVLPPDCSQIARMEAYQRFRDHYEAERFGDALACARRVVELSESDPERDYELPIAYNNLGATQFQLRDYPSAAVSYGKSLEMLEASQGISSRRLVVPLAGLGAVFAAQNEHLAAAELFERALAVSRRADGLFNLEQLPMLKQAADSRFAIEDYVGAEREHMYALKVAEQNYGYGDVRTLPEILDFAFFYERLNEYGAARGMYMRARDVAMDAEPGYSPVAVRALVGISRTHRLQYTINPSSVEDNASSREESNVLEAVWTRVEPRQSAGRDGLKSAQAALELLRSTANPPQELMTEALLEIGDWYQSTAQPELSLPYYVEAAAIFDARTAADPLLTNPLKTPRMVFYRPPVSAARSPNALPGRVTLRKTVFSFAVTDAGLPQDITVITTDMKEEQLAQSRRAMSKAIYSPRFAEGKAVSTAGVLFTSEWYDESVPPAQPQEPAATKPDEMKPAEEAPAGSPAGSGI